MAAFNIAESSVITVNDGAELDATTIAGIDGMLVVMYGGEYEPADNLYDVMSTNDAGDVTYAGLAVVLNNAQAGDVITVTGQNAEANSITVANGVTLNIEGMLTVKRTVTVSEGGILNLVDSGALSIGTANDGNVRAVPGTFTVNGTADIQDGTLTMNGGSENSKANVTSTGTLINGSAFTGNDSISYNGAYYQNSDLEYILTSLSKAIDGAVADEVVNVY